MAPMLDAWLLTVANLDPSDTTDELCCIFQEDWHRNAWGTAKIDAVERGFWRLFPELGKPWSPVDACVMAGIANGPVQVATAVENGRLVAPKLPRGWVLCQGWRGTPFGKGVSGHTFRLYVGDGPYVAVYDAAARLPARGEDVAVVLWTTYAAQFKGGLAWVSLRTPPARQ